MTFFARFHVLSAVVLAGSGLVLAASELSSAAWGQDWPQWRGPTRGGLAAQSPPLRDALPDAGLAPVWKRDLPSASGGGWGSPVVSDGKVYLLTHKKVKLADAAEPGPAKYPYLPPEKRGAMSEKEYEEYERNRRDEQEARSKNFRFTETLHCVGAADGQVLWENTSASVYTRFPQSGTPAVAAGRVFFLGAGRNARAVNAVTGESLWQTRLPGEFRDEHLHSSFAVAGDTALVIAGDLFALEASSGKIRWRSTGGTAEHTSPAVWLDGAALRVLANLDGKSTYCFDVTTGEELWRAPSEAGNATPVVAGDRLITYGSSRKRGLRCYRLTANGAEEAWVCHEVADSGSSPVVVGEHVYAQGERKFVCVSLAAGEVLWLADPGLGNPRYTSLAAAGDKVIYTFEDILCFGADPAEYKLLWRGKSNKQGLLATEAAHRKLLKLADLETSAEGQKEAERKWRQEIGAAALPCASPALSGGKLYVRTENGLACYDVRAR